MANPSYLQLGSLTTIAAVAGTIYIVLKLYQGVYTVFFHPLRKVPGPAWTALFRLPYAYNNLRGRAPTFLRSLHEQYGPVVRYSPNEVSVINGDQAWQEIYGHRTGKQKDSPSFEKDIFWYPSGIDNVPNLLVAPEGVHSRQRRVFAHAFSEKSLRNQEWLLQKYSDLLISRITDVDILKDGISDLTQWYAWTTFDVIADLTFGEPFHCLDLARTQGYAALIQGAAQVLPKLYCMHYWPIVQRIYQLVFGVAKSVRMRTEFQSYIKKKVRERIEMETVRQDFMTTILEKQSEEQAKGNPSISTAEITSTALILLAAGSETTSTVLTCTTYFMLRHPHVYIKVCDEVRSHFKSVDDITVEAVNGLTYTIAVLTEAMRIMPPIAAGFPRKVPPGGAMVSNYFLPGDCNISVSMTQLASYHDPSNFRNPEVFDPQRWLGGVEYSKDNRATFNPFSFGPRNCLGKNLAYAEMRLVFAKMVFAFDMKLEQGMDDWVDRCTFGSGWVKPPLKVKLAAA